MTQDEKNKEADEERKNFLIKQKNFDGTSLIEHKDHFRVGMGTEYVAKFLRSFICMSRPNRILEIGAGYTTPFILDALRYNEKIINEGNLNPTYFQDMNYDPKFVIIDNENQGKFDNDLAMKEIIDSKYTDFIFDDFQGKGKIIEQKYGKFDFVWFDCGEAEDYKSFINEYWEICSEYVIFHNTYLNGKANINLKNILEGIGDSNFQWIDIIEPHKLSQGSITIIKKV